ncbi:hypothetical protein HYR99_22180 [Candidatus Poribacteria bacterium]|nr:hypothetical protein [Candidatus Poribacteria bacterium]
MDKYQRGEQLDERIILDALLGKSLQKYPRFHAKFKPTYRGALELARKHGILRMPTIQMSTSIADAYLNPHTVYNVISSVRLGNRSVFGAARHTDAYIALERSFQNAVKQILYQDDLK